MMSMCIRAVEPDDGIAVREMYEGLSEEANFLRFHTAMRRLALHTLNVLMSNVPSERYSALALVDGECAGHAQWIRDKTNDSRADISLVVLDRWQRRGVGRAMLADLARTAASVGVVEFACYVHRANRVVHGSLTRLGAYRPADGYDEDVVLPLAAITKHLAIAP